MEDWPNSGRETTHDKDPVFIPDTPSPVFNRGFKPVFLKERDKCLRNEKRDKTLSSSTQEFKDVKRQNAFEKLKAIRQKKKSSRNVLYQNGSTSSVMRSLAGKAPRSRPSFSWPSDSESDPDSERVQSPVSSDHDSEGEQTLRSVISQSKDGERDGRNDLHDRSERRNGHIPHSRAKSHRHSDSDMVDSLLTSNNHHPKKGTGSNHKGTSVQYPDSPVPLRKRIKLVSAGLAQESERTSDKTFTLSPDRKCTSPDSRRKKRSSSHLSDQDFISAQQLLKKDEQKHSEKNSSDSELNSHKTSFRVNGTSSGKTRYYTPVSSTNPHMNSHTVHSPNSRDLSADESGVFHTPPEHPSWKSSPISSHFTVGGNGIPVTSQNNPFTTNRGASQMDLHLYVSPKKFYSTSTSPTKSDYEEKGKRPKSTARSHRTSSSPARSDHEGRGKGKRPRNTAGANSKVKGKSRNKQCSSSQTPTTTIEASRKRAQPSNSRASQHSLTIDSDSDEDGGVLVDQLETDEAMARKLQEEMDREYALMLTHVAPSPHRSPTHQPMQGHYGSHPQFPVGGPYGPGRFVGYPDQEEYLRMMMAEATSDSDDEDPLQNFPFMAAGLRGQNPLAMLTSHTAMTDPWPQQTWRVGVTRRSQTRRGRRGRMGRRNAVTGLTSPGFTEDDYEALLDLGERLGEVKQKGLTKNQINLLPVKKFKRAEGEGSSQNKECLICLSEFEERDNVRILTCFHDFHCTCIDKWLQKNNTCPICRVEVKLQ